MHKVPKISIIIPTLNEEKYISDCLDSVVSSEYPMGSMEVLIIDGMSDDATRELVEVYVKEYACIRLLDNPDKIVPIAMNKGIKNAKGEYLFRLDAHASYPADYFSKLVHWHQNMDADNIGTVIKTDVKNTTSKAMSIKAVLSHKLGVGDSDFRVGTDGVKEVDTVPFGCFPKKIFEQYGLYDERLVRNQDIELNKRIVNGGGKIYLVPDVQCTYFARENFMDLAKNQYQNGFWNILTAYYTKTFSSLSPRHFIPLLFVFSLLLPLLLSLIFPKMLWVAVVSLVSYLSLVIMISFRLKNSSNSVMYLILSFLILHFSYGLGSLMGIFSVFKKIIKGKK